MGSGLSANDVGVALVAQQDRTTPNYIPVCVCVCDCVCVCVCVAVCWRAAVPWSGGRVRVVRALIGANTIGLVWRLLCLLSGFGFTCSISLRISASS